MDYKALRQIPEAFHKEIQFVSFFTSTLGIVILAAILLKRKISILMPVSSDILNVLMIDLVFYFLTVGCLFLIISYFLKDPTPSPTYMTRKKIRPQPVRKRRRKQGLQEICGIGPVLEKKLNSFGIHTVEQLAGIDLFTLEKIKNEIPFPGRIEKEQWREQAIRISQSTSPHLMRH